MYLLLTFMFIIYVQDKRKTTIEQTKAKFNAFSISQELLQKEMYIILLFCRCDVKNTAKK